MYNIGVALLILGTIITFVSDKLFKNGKIPDMKTLLKVKLLGLGILIIGMLTLIKFS